MFVDWLSVGQFHGGGLRDFVGSLSFKGLGEDGEMGLDVCESAGPRAVRGSYDSSLQVKSHGGWIRVSGNPSRWSRPDNLFGFDLDECMGIVNAVLVGLSLPRFTRGSELQPTTDEIEKGLPGRWTGAAFSRVDLTENFVTGSELAARLAIRSYQSRAAAYLKKSTYGEETAMWHNTRRSVKAYRKGPDMVVHCPQSEWIKWANDHGVVRHEVEVKSRYLSGTNLRYWGNLNMATLHKLFEHETAVLRRPDASLDPLALEACPSRSRVAYAAWLRGEDVRSLVSRATYYRHRKTLMELASVDIAEPRRMADVVSIVRVIELQQAEPPAGYWQVAA